MLDLSTMRPIEQLESPAVLKLADEAQRFLTQQRWCKNITAGHLAWALTPPVAVFYFRVIPVRPEIDSELWVIVGDLPPAYIVCDNATNWQEALDAYGVEMQKWVDAVRAGNSVDNLIPVNVPRTNEYADMLESRIKFIWEEFVDKPIDTYPTEY
jgi:hypothetical protein